MNDNELVTHISRSHGGDVGAPIRNPSSLFFEFLKLQSSAFAVIFVRLKDRVLWPSRY